MQCNGSQPKPGQDKSGYKDTEMSAMIRLVPLALDDLHAGRWSECGWTDRCRVIVGVIAHAIEATPLIGGMVRCHGGVDHEVPHLLE